MCHSDWLIDRQSLEHRIRWSNKPGFFYKRQLTFGLEPKVTLNVEVSRDSRITKVIRFTVLQLGAYNPLEIPVEIKEIGWTGVADVCQVLNNETSAYSKLFIPCRQHCCCCGNISHWMHIGANDGFQWKASRKKDAKQWKTILGTPSCLLLKTCVSWQYTSHGTPLLR